MTLRRANMRDIAIVPRVERAVYQSGETPQYDMTKARVIAGSVQPLSSHMEANQYGQFVKSKLLLLTRTCEDLCEGMGVCVYTSSEEVCDYRIAAPPEKWRGHQRVMLESR